MESGEPYYLQILRGAGAVQKERGFNKKPNAVGHWVGEGWIIVFSGINKKLVLKIS